MVLPKPFASDCLKETRDKDSSLAAALKQAVFNQMPPKKCYFVLKYAKPCASDSLKEARDKDSSLAAALKRRFWQSHVLPILSKRPEIRIPAWRQLSKRRFSTRCLPKALSCVKYAKPCASDSLKETRDKDSSLVAALKRRLRQSRLFRFSQRGPR